MELGIDMAKRQTDLSFIRENSFNNKEFIVDMLVLFLNTTPALLEDLASYNTTQDWPQLSQAAHKIKAQVLTFGMDEAAALAHKIETDALAEQNLESINSSVTSLQEICNIAITEITADLEQLKSE